MAGRLINLGGVAVANEAVVGLELLEGVVGVVDQGETGGLSSSEVGAETEDGDGSLVGLVELSKLSAEVVLADVCENIPLVSGIR